MKKKVYEKESFTKSKKQKNKKTKKKNKCWKYKFLKWRHLNPLSQQRWKKQITLNINWLHTTPSRESKRKEIGISKFYNLLEHYLSIPSFTKGSIRKCCKSVNLLKVRSPRNLTKSYIYLLLKFHKLFFQLNAKPKKVLQYRIVQYLSWLVFHTCSYLSQCNSHCVVMCICSW